jgi:hypothetical protein
MDASGFLRRECSTCHRTFKARFSHDDALRVQRELSRQLTNVNNDEAASEICERHCPYCGTAAPDDGWFTAEQRTHLEHRAEHWAKQVTYTQLVFARSTLDANPNLTFVPVEPPPFDEKLPDELEDMRRFPLLCCREEIKLIDGWAQVVCCFYCGLVHQPQSVTP